MVSRYISIIPVIMYSGTFVVFSLTILVCGSNADCPDRPIDLHHEMRLHMNLSCASDGYYRPVKDFKTPVNIKLRFDFKYMTFDNDKETVTLFSWVVFKWKDEYLTWNVRDYGGIEEVQMESHEIWSPIFTLFNADIGMYYPARIYTTCLVTSDGMVTCVPHLAHTGICSTVLSSWPYDERNCTLYYTSWMQTEDKVNFTFYERDPVMYDEFQNAPGWKLMDIMHDRLPGNGTCCPYHGPMLMISFILKREAAGLAATVVIPTVVIVLLTLTSLLLNVNNNTRLSLICFSLFGHFIFISEISYLLPAFSSDTPCALLFIRDSMILTLLGIWQTLLLMSFTSKSSPPPNWVVAVNQLVDSGPTKYLVFTEFDVCAGEGIRLAEDDLTHEKRINTDWIEFANFVNSCVFFLFVVLYSFLLFIYFPADYYN